MVVKKSNSKNFALKMLALVFSVLVMLAPIFSATCVKQVEALTGYSISWQSGMRLTYVLNSTVEVNGVQRTDIPDTVGATIYYKTPTTERSINVLEAVENFIANSDTSKFDETNDRIYFKNFSTKDVNIPEGDRSVKQTATLILIPANTHITSELEFSYSIYADADTLSGAETTTKILGAINNVLTNILTPLIGVVMAIGTVFAIILGFKLARANNAEQRDEAKKRVIYTVVAIAVGVALILIFQLFARFSIQWLGADSNFFVV